jgi:hypothetical protein
LTGAYDGEFYRLQAEVGGLGTPAELKAWEERLDELAVRIPARAVRKLRALARRREERMGWY